MTTLEFTTMIKAEVKDVFDISRNIDFHIISASQTKEQAIDGKTSGLITLGEQVTFRGRHFDLYLTHTSKITEYDFPNYFQDTMIAGYFKSFAHQHFFYPITTGTKMVDIITYKLPFGTSGKVFNVIFFKNYLKKFIIQRNHCIQQNSENNL